MWKLILWITDSDDILMEMCDNDEVRLSMMDMNMLEIVRTVYVTSINLKLWNVNSV